VARRDLVKGVHERRFVESSADTTHDLLEVDTRSLAEEPVKQHPLLRGRELV
jgi:hypothetical protein